MNYRLIDFGEGRRLESIGDYCIDRPCAAAEGAPKSFPDLWPGADAKFVDRDRGWVFATPWPVELKIDGHDFSIPARPTPFGHIGFFPEQFANWRWIQELVARWSGARVLNLFGYTGGSTLAAAARGSSVTHVDAAKPNVEAARRGAIASGLADAPIRYIVDDARKYVARELRRGREYDLIVLDPPAYGHGRRGDAWRLEHDLWPLLDQCLNLLGPTRGAILLSGHSPAVGHSEAARWLRRGRPAAGALRREVAIWAQRSTLATAEGRELDSGFTVRAIWE